jgi:hypothetical protein
MIVNRSQWFVTSEHEVILEHVVGVLDGVWLAGGAARSLLTKEKVNDFDLFFRSEAAKDKAVASLEFQGFEVVFKCPEGKLTTLKKKGFPKVQCVSENYYPSREALIFEFDFTVCMFVADYDTLESTEQAFVDAFMKTLRLGKLTFPTATLTRMVKYIQYGYQPVKGFSTEFLKAVESEAVKDKWRAYID